MGLDLFHQQSKKQLKMIKYLKLWWKQLWCDHKFTAYMHSSDYSSKYNVTKEVEICSECKKENKIQWMWK